LVSPRNAGGKLFGFLLLVGDGSALSRFTRFTRFIVQSGDCTVLPSY
jgi:hypothetical protein